MAVTVEDVRNQLNEISEQELSSKTIELEIQSAERKVTSLGLPSGDLTDEYIRKRAAYKSFIQSSLYTRIDIHDLLVQRAIKEKLAALKEDMDEALDDLTDEYEIESTAMFDARPEDPDNPCEWPRSR